MAYDFYQIIFMRPKREGSFYRYCSPKFSYVNKNGVRFSNETGWEVHIAHWSLCHWDPYQPGYPQLPVYGICDKEALDAGPLAIPSGLYRTISGAPIILPR
jgi:hypothetical protein